MKGLEEYIPSTWQSRYHALTTFEALGAGSAGPGKSMCLLMDPLRNVMIEHERCRDKRHPYHIPWGKSLGRTLHLRRNYKMLTDTINRSKYYFPLVDPEADWSETKLTWTFSSGYKYEFGHCQNPGDWQAYQSREFEVICFDELTQFEKGQYDGLMSRCRSSDAVWIGRERVRSMSNPMLRQEGAERLMVADPTWVRKRFVDPAPQGNIILYYMVKRKDGTKVERSRIYLPAKLHDNPNVAFREAYEATLLSLPEHLRKIMLEGDWYYQIGSYFGNVWDSRIHINKPFAVPASWRRFRAMDWGYKTTGTVIWLALSEEDELFVEREYNFIGIPDRDVAKRIIEIEKAMGLIPKNENASRLTGPADTQIWEQRGELGKSKAAVFAENGVRWVPADKKNRIDKAEKVHARLADHGNGTKTPGLVFMSNCVKCIQTVPAIQANPMDPAEPLAGGEDHWYAAISYAVAYASRRGVGKSVDDIEEQDERAGKEPAHTEYRGQHGYGAY